MQGFFANAKDWVDLIQGLLTIVAIGAGGYWFWRRRQQLPRAKTSHEIQSWKLPDGRWLLRVCVTIENLGEILLELEHGFTRVQQMRPWPEKIESPPAKTLDRKTEVEWSLLVQMDVDFKNQQREIEPHESDMIPFEFVVTADVEVVVIYTYIRNKKKKFKQSPFTSQMKEIGWSVTTVHELQETT